MDKSLAIWAAVVVLGLMVNQQSMGQDDSSDSDLLIGGPFVAEVYVSDRDYLVDEELPQRSTSVPTLAPSGDGVFADVQMEMWNMEIRFFAELRGTDKSVECFVRPISVE